MKAINTTVTLSVSKADATGTTSKDAEDETLYINEVKTSPKWDSRNTFILYVIGYSIGLGNVWSFPYKVYINGQGSFILLYTIFLFCLGVPVLTFEFTLGQFSSRDCTQVFQMVPLFVGLGWSMIMLAALVTMYYSVTIAYGYYYLFTIIFHDMIWNHCNNNFNSFSCVSSFMKKPYVNETVVSSTKEYFEYKILKSDMYKPYWRNSGLSSYCLISLSLSIFYFIPITTNVFGKIITSRVLYFTVIYPYFIAIILFFLTFTFEGSLQGITFFFTPQWSKLFEISVILQALEQMFLSLGLGVGVMITMSSFNNFHNKVMVDVIFIVIVHFLTSILFGLVVFSTIGYLSHKLQISIENVIKNDWEMYFVAFATLLANLNGATFWTFNFMLIFVCLGIDAQIGFLETITKGIFETFPRIKKSFKTKVLLECATSTLLLSTNILFFFKYDITYINIIYYQNIKIYLAVFILLEIVLGNWIYNFRILIEDYEMMTGSTKHKIWAFITTFPVPAILILYIVFNIKWSTEEINFVKGLPWWANIISICILCTFISPIVVGFMYTLVYYYMNYNQENIKTILERTVSPSPEWGPYIKSRWFSSIRYNKKLKNVINDKIFKKSFTYNDYLDTAGKGLSQ